MTDTTLTTISPDMTLGDLINQHPSLARNLEKLGIDYCCGGHLSLGQAATNKGLDPGAVVTELSLVAVPEDVPWRNLGARDLVDHVESTHHQFLWEEMPRVSALLNKIVEVHGGRHPELVEIRTTYEQLRTELEPHMRKEELMLFPAIRALAADEAPPTFPFGSVQNPISKLMSEHDAAGDLLEKLSEMTNGYQAPADGCATYQATFAGLAQIESDTHLHVHKENNLLFPMVVALEADIDAAGTERVGTMAAACHDDAEAAAPVQGDHVHGHSCNH
ncbi:MAG: iron-sulfur cluster repair di-iron protein [Aquihabitans sp.]